jgi:hypothetical protein
MRAANVRQTRKSAEAIMLKLLAQSQDSLAHGERTCSSEDVRRRVRATIKRICKR